MFREVEQSPFGIFDLMVKNFFDGPNRGTFSTLNDQRLQYPIDIIDLKGSIIVEVACVDANVDDIEVTTEGDVLRIKRTNESGDIFDPKAYIHRSISKKDIDIGFKVAGKYDLDRLTVKLDKGILRITIPIKAAEKQEPKKIPISID